MKKIISLLFLPLLTFGQNKTANILLQVDLMSNLKTQAIKHGTKVFLVGKYYVNDGLGGLYMYDSSSNVTQDTVYINSITSNLSSTGRWLRVFQKAKAYPQGILVSNGGVKTLFVSGTTDSNGEITINLTGENTSGGTALFKEVWAVNVNPTTDASSVTNAIQSYRKSLPANLKTCTYGFYKANALTITLGLLYNPFTSVGAGTIVNFRVEGI